MHLQKTRNCVRSLSLLFMSQEINIPFQPSIDSLFCSALSSSFVRYVCNGFRNNYVLSLSYVGVVTAIALPIARLFSSSFFLYRGTLFSNQMEICLSSIPICHSCWFKFSYLCKYYKFFVNNLELNKLIGLFTSHIFCSSLTFNTKIFYLH